jgi:hypothetical protein
VICGVCKSAGWCSIGEIYGKVNFNRIMLHDKGNEETVSTSNACVLCRVKHINDDSDKNVEKNRITFFFVCYSRIELQSEMLLNCCSTIKQ